MADTPEEIHTRNRLEEALRAHLEATGSIEEGEFLTDWAIVAAATDAQHDSDREMVYGLAFSGGRMHTHTAVGLFHHAIYLLHHGHLEDDDDDG